jgi:hypothetical protein
MERPRLIQDLPLPASCALAQFKIRRRSLRPRTVQNRDRSGVHHFHTIRVLEQAAQSLPLFESAREVDGRNRSDQPVIESLVISFLMIMDNKLMDCPSQYVFAKEDHLV